MRGRCGECKKVRKLEVIKMGIAGTQIKVKVCVDCAEKIQKLKAFAMAFGSSVPSNGEAKKDKKYEQYELSPEEIAETQRLRPTIRMPASPKQRDADSVDKIAQGSRVRIYQMGDGRLGQARNERVIKKAQAMLGTSDVKVISDNGFEVLVEAINK